MIGSFVDALTGKDLKNVYQSANKAADKQFDPNILNPVLDENRRMASEGINEDPMRQKAVAQLFNETTDMSAMYGGNQASAISGAEARDAARARALATIEYEMGIQDESAKMQGRVGLAENMTKANQMVAERDATKDINKMNYEASKSQRVGAIASTVIGSAMKFMGGPAAAAIPGAGSTVASDAIVTQESEWLGFDPKSYSFSKWAGSQNK